MAFKNSQLPFLAICFLILLLSIAEISSDLDDDDDDDDEMEHDHFNPEQKKPFVYSDWSFWEGVNESDLLATFEAESNLNSIIMDTLRSRRQEKNKDPEEESLEPGELPGVESDEPKTHKPGEVPWNRQSGLNQEALEEMLIQNLRWTNECAEKLGVTLDHSRLTHFEDYFTNCVYNKYRQESHTSKKSIHYTSVTIALVVKCIVSRY